jgi:hypothetical protein
MANRQKSKIRRLVKDELKTAATSSKAETPIQKPGNFDLNKFKSKRGATIANVGTLQGALPHCSIAEANDFVRLHPDEENYWSAELCFVKFQSPGRSGTCCTSSTKTSPSSICRARKSCGSVWHWPVSHMTCFSCARCRRKTWTIRGTLQTCRLARYRRRRGCKLLHGNPKVWKATKSTLLETPMLFLHLNGRRNPSMN